MWPRSAIAEVALVSTPSDLGNALASYAETGIDELALILVGEPGTHPEIVRRLAAAQPPRR